MTYNKNYLLAPINRYYKNAIAIEGDLLTIDSTFRFFEKQYPKEKSPVDCINALASFYRDLTQMEGGSNLYWTYYDYSLTKDNFLESIDRIRSKVALLLFSQIYELLESYLKDILVVFFERNPDFINKAKVFKELNDEATNASELVDRLSKKGKNNRKILWSIRKLSKDYRQYETANIYNLPLHHWLDLISDVRHLVVHQRQRMTPFFASGLRYNSKQLIFNRYFSTYTWDGEEYIYLNKQTAGILINSVHDFALLVFKSLSLAVGLNPKYSKMRTIEDTVKNCSLCHSLGVFYDAQRRQNFEISRKYLPTKVKTLWIVESPPLSDPPRYFYRPELTRYDGLFREVMKVLQIPVSNPKDESLRQFAARGHFLIDAMKCPADKSNGHLKPEMLKNCAPILAQEIRELDPEKILIIKADTFKPVYETVSSIGMADRMLNKSSIPFPGSGQQVRFRQAIEKLLNPTEKQNNTVSAVAQPQKQSAATIVVDNITINDVISNQLRITVANKHLFPAEVLGSPITHPISVSFNGRTFDCSYRIGSLDEKSRSGVLKLGNALADALNLNYSADNVRITRLAPGKYLFAKTPK